MCCVVFTVKCCISALFRLTSASEHYSTQYLPGTANTSQILSNFPMLKVKHRALVVNSSYKLCHRCPSTSPYVNIVTSNNMPEEALGIFSLYWTVIQAPATTWGMTQNSVPHRKKIYISILMYTQ